MSKKLTRFELFNGGESQKLGFIRGLEDMDISEDLKSALVYNFNKELKLPPKSIYKRQVDKGYYIASYFTEKGLQKFSKEIKDIINVVNDEGMYTVGKIITLQEKDLVLYEDEYQVIQLANDITDITVAVLLDTEPDKQLLYSIEEQDDNSKRIATSVSLKKSDKHSEFCPNIIVYPFYMEGELKYYIDTKQNFIKI